MKDYSKIACVYHSMDLDGICSRDIVKKYEKEQGKEVSCFGWNHGDPVPNLDDYDKIYIVDISFHHHDMVHIAKLVEKKNTDVIWIDHHFTAMEDSEKYGYSGLSGLREVGIAACELCWTYLFSDKHVPMAVKLLSAYDVWKKDRFDWEDVTLPFQYGMRLLEGTGKEIPEVYLSTLYKPYEGPMKDGVCFEQEESFELIDAVIKIGNTIIAFEKQKYKKHCELYSFEADFMGMKVICLNTLDFSSNTFLSVYNPEIHDAMLAFADNGREIKCSLYTTKEDLNVGEIARELGGGGHKQAAGFQLPYVVFLSFQESKIFHYDVILHTHYKGEEYELITSHVMNESTNQSVALYRSKKHQTLHVRNTTEFFGTVLYEGKEVNRFESKLLKNK